jgi:hypothetical protein
MLTTATLKTNGDFFSLGDAGKSIRFADDSWVAIVKVLDAQTVIITADPMPSIVAQSFKVVDAIWHRTGMDYSSILESGLDAFGSQDVEKQMDGYLPVLSSKSANTKLGIAIRGAVNPAKAVDLITSQIKDPQNHNLLSIIAVSYYYGDRITASGVNASCELTSRMFRIAGANAQSFGKQ